MTTIAALKRRAAVPMDGYPATVVEILDDRMTFRPAALRAMREFRASHPWRGDNDQRKAKFQELVVALAEAYQIAAPELLFDRLDGSSSGASSYDPSRHRIVLRGRLSVITLLHEFAHARGMSERAAVRWSVNLFRRVFPRSFSRLVHRGHLLLRAEDVANEVCPDPRS